MIQGFKLTTDYVQFYDSVGSWEEAIQLAAKPLLIGGQIKQSYIDGMIESVKEHGPYIVIAPNIAIPHARPELGSVEIGYSVTLLQEPVSFTDDEENKARLLISLSCVDADRHLEMLQAIVMVLSDENKQEALFNAMNAEEVLEIFNT
ncbi:PTS sugar transporter subunit IIA [Vallitalea okinawensis]|uniref:PTS sugar transporter subunit IIA n=1 Tax=Vallitalea okinawensis TaxID=2078660 RepID=UPI000CFC6331|nr:PTS sugar transporter subunit IIA [Vallitalea okinawensis]